MSATDKDKATVAPARVARRGPRAVGQDVSAVIRHHLTARGFGQIELVTRWYEIAGAGLAEHCFPYRLSAGGASGAVLTLIADDRAALELQHQAPKLIDKINGYFGRPTVAKIKVTTGAVPRQHQPRKVVRALTSDEEATLAHQVDGVEDPDLRAALMRLGRSALGETTRKRPPLGR